MELHDRCGLHPPKYIYVFFRRCCIYVGPFLVLSGPTHRSDTVQSCRPLRTIPINNRKNGHQEFGLYLMWHTSRGPDER